MSDFRESLTLAGRLHPLLVHLPIGLLVLLVFLEVLTRFPRLQRANASSGYILALPGSGLLYALVPSGSGRASPRALRPALGAPLRQPYRSQRSLSPWNPRQV